MEDIVPELLNLIQNEFADAYEADKEITELIEKIDSGKATGADLDAYAARTGDLLAETLHSNISSDTLPDGRMYYNIANRILSPVLEKNYNLVADVAAAVQEQLNERAGIGIRPMKPEINRDRINGLVDLASDAEQYDDVSGQVESGVVNYTQSVATDAVHENAEFHYKAGLTPRIVRTAEAGCCQWCQDLQGTYDYQDVRNTGNDVYRRHRNCKCTVEYDPSNGSKRQNVHSKQYSWKEDNEPLIEQRLQYVKGELSGPEKYQRNPEQEMEYHPVEYDSVSAKTIQRGDAEITILRALNTQQDIYVSDNVVLKPRQLHEIDARYTEALRKMGVNDKESKPRLIVLSTEEMGTNAPATYNAVQNIISINEKLGVKSAVSELQEQFTMSDNRIATYIHELYHWTDAEAYRRIFGNITAENYADYAIWCEGRAKNALDRIPEKRYNQFISTSQYAEREKDKEVWTEVYTEFRTFVLLGG